MGASVIFVLICYSVSVLVLVLGSLDVIVIYISTFTENTGMVIRLDDVAIGLELAYLHVQILTQHGHCDIFSFSFSFSLTKITLLGAVAGNT